MAESLNINDLLSQVKQLAKEDQLMLLQRMEHLLKKDIQKRALLLDWLHSLVWAA